MRWLHDEPADADGYPAPSGGPAPSAPEPSEPAAPQDGPPAVQGDAAADAQAAAAEGPAPLAAGPPPAEAGMLLAAVGARIARERRAVGRRGAWRTVGVAVAGVVVGAIAATAAVPALRARAQGLPSISTVPVSAAQQAAGSPAASVFAKLGPSVVLVQNEQAAQASGPFGQQAQQTDWGSGVIFSTDGYIVTNDHVVDNASKVTVTLADGTTYPATVVGGDPSTDLAVIKITPTQPLQAATFADSSDVVAGEVAIAIGNPLGPQYAQSVDQGIVSAVRPLLYGFDPNQERVTTMIQTDASINPGNSGGPLANTQGDVIGIVSMKTVGTGEQGVQAAGLGFAIPSNVVAQVANELIQYGYYHWPWLGIDFAGDVASALPSQAQTLTIQQVQSGTPADGKLQAGDAIKTWNGQPVLNYYQLVGDITTAQPGQTVTIGVLRNGQNLSVQLTLGTEPESEVLGQTPAAQTAPQQVPIPGSGGTFTLPTLPGGFGFGNG